MQLVSLVFLAAYVSAHATFQELWIGETDAGSSCARLPASNSPVTDVTSADIACNTGAASSSGVCPMAAGDSVTVEMHQQPNDRSCANEAIGGNHFGPQMIYMAAVDDATTAVGSEASWFKIHEMGLMSNSPDYFGNQVLNDNCGHYTFTIPDVAPGQYLLRAETIALHTAGSEGGAQFYMTCFQVNVTGSGTAQPDTVSLPGAYSAQDPGILINIYQQLDDYTVPGPAPYGFTAPAPINSAYPTTATWDTALQPTTVPTEVPEYTAGAGGATTSEVAATSAATSVATSVAASSSAAVPTSVASSSVAATTSVVSSVAVPVETSSAPSTSEVVSTSAAYSTSAAQSTSAAVSTSAAASTAAASTCKFIRAKSTSPR
ncbi:glycosyl hydrolase family 61-domain-containing protein [Schizophyllum commune]